MTEHNISKFQLDKIADKLGGKFYTQVVADKYTEHKRIVIEYGHKKIKN